MSEQRTELENLGEFGLIDHLTKKFKPSQASTITGIGDDAAVLSFSDEEVQLISTDMLI